MGYPWEGGFVGVGGRACDGQLDYESFRLNDDEACITVAESVLRDIGLTPVRTISNGGLDANWMHVHGIPTVTLGCGQMNAHTNSERLDIVAFHTACRAALRLAMATEQASLGD